MSGVKLTLVSGANRGIGLEVARSLARDGYRVLAGTRSLDAMGDVGGLDITPIELDVTDPESIARIPFEPLEVLVNNAGIYPGGRATRMDFELAERAWQTNALGAWRLAVAAIPHMSRGGRIVNVSSQAGSLETMPDDAGMPAYNVSKTALNAITRLLAVELEAEGILVNAVCPGWVRTDMGGASATRSVEEGAASVLWAARLGPDGPTGGFFRDGKALAW
jgi:NAD(P)-dependent dehydrogenase (short-subunit alcohol dehydrogenase family)